MQNLPAYTATQMRLRWLGVPLWHQAGYTGKGIKICVVDADTNTRLARYPDKVINYRNSGTADWTQNHGNHGLATIDIFQQIAPEADIYFASWEHSLESILQWCIERKIDIVNVSLRYSARPVSEATSQKAVDQGMLLFTSAGNMGDVPTDLRGYPARDATWVAVGAGIVNGYGEVPERVGYSSTGKELEVMGMTHLLVQLPPPANFMLYSGTSCASPTLAACFALIEQKMGDLTKNQIRQMFLEHCLDMDDLGHDRRTGWGMFKMPHPITGKKINEIVLKIDSNEVSVNSIRQKIDQAPIIDDNSHRTLVPISFIGRTMGHKVEWKEETKEVVIDDRIILTIGNNMAKVDGQEVQIDQAPYIDKNTWRTLVPLSFISRQLGYNVFWNEPTRQIVIV